MKTRFLLGAAAAAIAFGGVTVATRHAGDEETAAPFLHPLLIARSLCGEKADGLAKRRAFFIKAANA